MKKTVLFAALIIASLLVIPAFASDQYAPTINKDNPGTNLDINQYAEKGKITIFDFYSVYCGPCMRLAPYLEKLDAKRTDIVVKKIDINRKGKSGIDWQSPLTKQYSIKAVPHFVIIGADGKIIATGRDAQKQIVQYLNEAGI